MTIAYKTTKRRSATLHPAFDQRGAVAAFGNSSTRFNHRT